MEDKTIKQHLEEPKKEGLKEIPEEFKKGSEELKEEIEKQ